MMHLPVQIRSIFSKVMPIRILADLDRFIGWSSPQRQRNLHLVLNNHRFPLLPWVRSPNLASRALGLVCRRLADDWLSHYGYRPVLLETFSFGFRGSE